VNSGPTFTEQHLWPTAPPSCSSPCSGRTGPHARRAFGAARVPLGGLRGDRGGRPGPLRTALPGHDLPEDQDLPGREAFRPHLAPREGLEDRPHVAVPVVVGIGDDPGAAAARPALERLAQGAADLLQPVPEVLAAEALAGPVEVHGLARAPGEAAH
jgi:hypothetical protein